MEWVGSFSIAEAAKHADQTSIMIGAASVSCIHCLVEGVKFIHSRYFRVSHTAIKANNVLVLPDCKSIKTIDAGIAVAANMGLDCYCTPGYTPPELQGKKQDHFVRHWTPFVV